jgi:ribosome-associated toxin RatA of RatAB toxin-antitoxin module
MPMLGLFRTFALLRAASFAAFIVGSLLGAPALAAPPVELTATRKGGVVELRMHTTLLAPHALIWATLTDYENQAKWIPGMVSSKVLERKAPHVIVEQKGHADVLFMSFAVDVVVQATERPPTQIDVKMLSGNLRRLEGGYQLRAKGGSVDEYDLEWQGTIEPDTHLPGFMSMPIVRNNIRHQFESMVAEIERRANALRDKR